MEAKKGLYLGPLRLLAAEVYETLTANGIYTNLYTVSMKFAVHAHFTSFQPGPSNSLPCFISQGQERRHIAFSTHASATIEMANLKEEYDIVVLDEIQMVADVARGAAWTKALLGLRCKEIHVCGGLEATDIVQKIAKACGDDFEMHTYERFSALEVADRSLSNNPKEVGCYKNVRCRVAAECAFRVFAKDLT
jgi:ATP-dependent RNA helicase SUPV3L1/SUV3